MKDRSTMLNLQRNFFMVFILSSLLLLATLSHGFSLEQKVIYNLKIEVFKNDTAILESITVNYGIEDDFPMMDTGYKIKVLSYDDKELFTANLWVAFRIEDVPPEFPSEFNYTFVYPRVPAFSTAKRIVIYHSDKKILDVDLSKELCDRNMKCDLGENKYNCPEDCLKSIICGDSICEGEENYRTCSKDCSSGSKDNYCDAIIDGRCDPDCLPNEDLDCKVVVETTTTLPIIETTTITLPSTTITIPKIRCGNGICDFDESYRLCPQDCPSGVKDGYCDFVIDGKCDPDCSLDEDKDCIKEETTKDFSYFYIIIIGILIFLGIIFLIVYNFFKKTQKVKEEKSEEKLIEFITKKLKEGEDPEVLKKILREEGFNENLVEKAEKKLW